MKFKIMLVTLFLIFVFGNIYLKDNVKFSNSREVISYKNDYEIGFIKFKNINRKIMQGLDNKYYLDHNYLNMDSDKGEFFLDTYGDLLNNKNAIIYAKLSNLDISDINIDEVININYLTYDFCYKVVSINNYLDNDLVIKLLDNNIEFNVYFNKINC